MYKNLILFLIGYISLLGVSAQQIYFNKVYDLGAAEWGLSTLSKDSFNVVVGWKTDFSDYGDVFMAKFNNDGDTISNKYLSNETFRLSGEKILSTNGNGYFLLSYSRNNKNPDFQNHLYKLNNNFGVHWEKEIGDTSLIDGGLDMRYNKKGNIIIFGSRYYQDEDQQILLYEVDTNGNLIREMEIGDSAVFENCYGVVPMEDGGYILGGYHQEPGDFDWLVMRIDSVGNTIWKKTYGGEFKDRCEGVVKISNSSVLAIGFENTNENPLKTEAIARKINMDDGNTIWKLKYEISGMNSDEYWFDDEPIVEDDFIMISGGVESNNSFDYSLLTKIDTNGNKIWMRQYYNDPSKHQYCRAMTPTHDGGYLLTGSVLNNPNDLWLLKVDSMGCAVPRCDTICGRLSGDFTYERISNDSFQYQFVDTSQAVNFRKWTFGDGEETPDSLAPDTVTHTYAQEGTYEVCRTVRNACFETSTVCDSVTIVSTGMGQPPGYVAAPKLYQNVPNPAANSTSIKYAMPKGVNGVIALYDIRGRLIEQFRLTNKAGSISVKLDEYPQGVVIYKLETATYPTISRKMIIR